MDYLTKYDFEFEEYTSRTITDHKWVAVHLFKKGENEPIAMISTEEFKQFRVMELNKTLSPSKRDMVLIPIKVIDSETPREFIQRCIDELTKLIKAINEADKPTDFEQIKTALIKEVLNTMESVSIPKKGEALKELLISTISSISSEEDDLLSDLALVICEVLKSKINEAMDGKHKE